MMPGVLGLEAGVGGPGARASRRKAMLVLLVLMLASLAIGIHGRRPPPIYYGDAPGYLVPAYHLVHSGVYSSDWSGGRPAPDIGREPGYPLMVAALMALDPGLGRVGLDCIMARAPCDPSLFASVSVANLVLVEATGLVLFLMALRATGSHGIALVAAAYVLLNVEMNRYWYFPMSDWLAVFLVVSSMAALAFAWRSGRILRWGGVGAALAALTLTKAVFLPFVLLMAGTCALRVVLQPARRRGVLQALVAAGLVYALLVGGWIGRNAVAAGQARLTDTRGGIALSTREVFDHMTPAQYAAAFVYWTRGGPRLARLLFGEEVVGPFDLDRPDGFYDRGQNGYGRRVAAIAAERGVDAWTASAMVDRDLGTFIVTHPLAHAATTLPLLYRGIWSDEFAPLGIVALVWLAVRAIRRRDGLFCALFGIGIFNELFYALFSLNTVRYQMTAIPSVALAVGLAVQALWSRWRARRAPVPGDVAVAHA